MKLYAYFHKKIVPLEEANINIMTHAFNYGTACFEGIRGNWNKEEQQLYLFRLKEHFERLIGGCRMLKMELPYTVEDYIKIALDVIRKSDCHEDVYVRPLAYKSSQVVGVRLHNLECDYCMFISPFGPYLDLDKGARCCTSKWRRISDTMMPTQAKACGIYVSSALAKTEAFENGYDEAILLTNNGFVSDGSGENIFVLRDGKFATPPLSDDALLGVTRTSVITLLKNELGLEVEERSISRSELYSADEAFFTGTAAHIVPIVSVDNCQIGTGAVGKTTKKLQNIFFDVVQGKNKKYLEWCTPVYAR